LGSEAEHWRAIRDSRNPADFMDYLARYGPEGAFAEVAELRLKQLTSRTDPPPPTRAPASRTAPLSRPSPALPPSRPAMRMETPPPSRRAEAPPVPTRRPEPVRRPPPERTYEREELRDPPKEGGALRAFILIALLGGAALAGGLYFGGGIPDFGGTPQEEQVADTGAPSAPLEDALADAQALDEPVGVPLQDAASERPAQVAARREPPPRENTREPRETPARDTRDSVPSPTTTFAPPTNTAANNAGGPVSLSPGTSSGNTSSNVSIDPLPSQVADQGTTQVAAATPPQARPQRAATVVWSQRPSARRIAELYPARALREGVGGRVALDCSVSAGSAPSCSVASESPAGLGFGRAALSAANSYRASPTMSDGASSNGQRTRIVVQFQAPQQ
jgi:TonB family protein